MQTLEALPMFKVKKLFPQAFRQSSFHSLLHTSPTKKASYYVDGYNILLIKDTDRYELTHKHTYLVTVQHKK